MVRQYNWSYKLLIIVRPGIYNSGRSLVEFTATTTWYEALNDSMQISQPNLLILWTQEEMDPEIVFILIILLFDKSNII